MTAHIAPEVSLLRTENTLVVRNGEQVHTIAGRATTRLVERLLTASKGGALPQPDEVTPAWEELVELLSSVGLITTEPGMGQVSESARLLWKRSGGVHSLLTIHEALTRAVVPVVGVHPVAERIRTILRDGGIAVGDDAAGARGHDAIAGSCAMSVMVATSIDDPALGEHNTRALRSGQPWLPVLLDDAGRCVVGPFIVPSSSACYRCYTLRRAANFPDRRVVPMLSAGAPLAVDAPAVDTMGLSWFVAGLAVEKVVERIALGDHSTMTRPGSFATVERAHPGIRVDEHRTLRVPRCPACSPRREFGLPQVWHHGGDGA